MYNKCITIDKQQSNYYGYGIVFDKYTCSWGRLGQMGKGVEIGRFIKTLLADNIYQK